MSYLPMPASLATARLTLGPWHDDDLDAYDAMVHERDPRGAAAPRDGRPTREEMRATLAAQQRSLGDTGIALYAVRRDDVYLGYCGLTIGHASIDEPEIAYELLRADHGHGYATEAARAVLAAAVAAGRDRLWATVRPWNDASGRVLTKIGFVRTDRITTDAFGESVWWRYASEAIIG